MLWISVNRYKYKIQNLFMNCWELKVHAVNPGSIAGRFFFSAHCRCVKSFFGQWTYAGFISYPYALPGYTVYIFIPNHPAPHPTTPSSPQQWSTRHYRSWKTCVLFPTSHISFVTQHTLHVSVTGNIFRSDARYLHKELCHLWKQVLPVKWPILVIRGLWAMRFSDISGHRTTAKYSDLYRSARDYE